MFHVFFFHLDYMLGNYAFIIYGCQLLAWLLLEARSLNSVLLKKTRKVGLQSLQSLHELSFKYFDLFLI